MTQFVLDASVALSWCFEDEGDEYTESVLEKLHHATAIVPALWMFEVVNAVVTAERRRRMTEAKAGEFFDVLAGLPIEVDVTGPVPSVLFNLARRTKISGYDAAYLELALRNDIPLATADRQLRVAAAAANAAVLNA